MYDIIKLLRRGASILLCLGLEGEIAVGWALFRMLFVLLLAVFFYFTFIQPGKSVKEHILILNDLGTVGLLLCSGAEGQIFTLSAQGFDLATFWLAAQRSNH